MEGNKRRMRENMILIAENAFFFQNSYFSFYNKDKLRIKIPEICII